MSYDLLLCMLLFTIVGIVDDVKRLRAFQKLILQFAAGVVTVIALPQGTVAEQVWTILWIVVFTNAFNLIDGIDGLAISYACITFGWSLIARGPNIVVFTLLGACLGFLPFNIYKARFYLGDSGSHALGAAIGYLTVPFVASVGNFEIADLLVVTLPLADILFVTITRRMRRSGITTGGTDHIAHRLARVVGSGKVLPLLVTTSLISAGLCIQARSVTSDLQVAFVLVMWADASFLVTMLEQRTRKYF